MRPACLPCFYHAFNHPTSCSSSSSTRQNSPHDAQGTVPRAHTPSLSWHAKALRTTASPHRAQLLRRLGHASSRCASRSAGSKRRGQRVHGRRRQVERMCRTMWAFGSSSAHSGHLGMTRRRRAEYGIQQPPGISINSHNSINSGLLSHTNMKTPPQTATGSSPASESSCGGKRASLSYLFSKRQK